MTEQLRPVDGRQDACTKCGYRSGDDWSQCGGSCPMPGSPHFNQHLISAETALLREVGDIIRKAQAEYAGGFEIAGRLEITHAQRLLDRVFHGEAV